MLFLESKLQHKFLIFIKQHTNEVSRYKFSISIYIYYNLLLYIYYKFVMLLIWSINDQHVTGEL